MTREIAFGDRLFLPVLTKRRPREAGAPPERLLWVYVLDPASLGLRSPVARVAVPYEPLPERISGERFAVKHEPLPEFMVKALDWPQRLVDDFNAAPLNLDASHYAVDGGVRPSTGQPQFAGQMVYAVCQRVFDTFTKALGRDPVWGPWAHQRIRNGEAAQLLIRPFACFEANAWYDARAGTLEFGVCHARSDTDSPHVLPGGLVLLALSHDVIAHEVTHALLDGMRAHFMRDSNPDVMAFHEAFSDIVALFHHFQVRELVEQAIESSGELGSKLLLQLAREFGEAIHGREGHALRAAVTMMQKEGNATVIKLNGEQPAEPHDRGAVLVAAVFSAFLEVYGRRAETFFRLAKHTSGAGPIPHELVMVLADEACRLAAAFLHICIRAIDYCPPTDLRFGEYLRAMITADRMLNHADPDGIRDALIKSFRRRAITIQGARDLSEYSLEWNGPARAGLALESLQWSQLRLSNDGVTPQNVKEIERQATELARFMLGSDEVLREFGLRRPGGPYGPITIESLRPVVRRMYDGRLAHGLVGEVSQTRDWDGHLFVGGATVLFDEEGVVRFAIRKRVDDDERALHEQRFGALPERAGFSTFRNLHAAPARPA